MPLGDWLRSSSYHVLMSLFIFNQSPFHSGFVTEMLHFNFLGKSPS